MSGSSSTVENHYVIELTDGEQKRLVRQYKYLNKMGLAGRTISDVTYTLPEGARVLDSATGTGAWLLDLARTAPATAEFYGIDISSALFPTSSPPNMHFMQQSATSLPAEWSNSFDLINQRLLLTGLRAPDWQAVLSEQYRVLKPGVGHIQFLEVTDWLPTHTPAQRRISGFVRSEFEKKGLDPDCGTRIPEYLLKAGFCDVTVHIRYLPFGKWAGEDGVNAKEVAQAGKIAILEGALREGAPGVMSREECERDMREIEREWDENPGSFFRLHVIEARKP